MTSHDQRLATLLMGDFIGLLRGVFERGREELVLTQSAALTRDSRMQRLQEGSLHFYSKLKIVLIINNKSTYIAPSQT